MLKVIRRFPDYEFVIETRLTVEECRDRLRSHLAGGDGSKGTFRRQLDGDLDGSLFRLRPRYLFWGFFMPWVEGSFNPTDEGVIVEARGSYPLFKKFVYLAYGLPLVLACLITRDLFFCLFVFGLVLDYELFLLLFGSDTADTLDRIFSVSDVP